MFPSLSNLADTLIYYGRIKSYLLMIGEELQKEDPNVDEIKKDLIWFQVHNKPMNFRSNDTDNVIIEMDRIFVTTCSMMENNGSSNPHLYSCIQFYAKLDYLRKLAEPTTT